VGKNGILKKSNGAALRPSGLQAEIHMLKLLNVTFIVLVGFLFILPTQAQTQTQNIQPPAIQIPPITHYTDHMFPLRDFGAASVSPHLVTADAKGAFPIVTTNKARQHVRTLEGRAQVRSYYWKGQDGHPLVILIPGIGGASDESNANHLAKIFQSVGFHVLTFNDPVSWGYALTVSANGAPGNFPEDSKVFYRHIQDVLARTITRFQPQYSGIWLLGYSLGAQYAQEILKIDDVEKKFNFQRVFLLNPPLDIGYTLDKYDQINKEGDKIIAGGLSIYDSLYGELLSFASELLKITSPADQLKYYMTHYPLSKRQSEILIGGSFKSSLDEVLFVASIVNPHSKDFFKSYLDDFNRQNRYSEIHNVTFGQYFKNFVFPDLNIEQKTMASTLVATMSMKYNMNNLLQDPRVRFVLTADDPISSPDDIALFAQEFKERTLLLQVGGHCGMYWFPAFAADFKAFIFQK
jgi:pimeloyl-ACP methyl ester carboxylesterase